MVEISVFQHRIKLLIDSRFSGNKSEFSRVTGIPESTIRSYLAGNYPKLDKIAELCEALDVSADWLILGRGVISQKENLDVNASTFVTTQVMINKEERFLNIIESQQRQLETQARTIELLAQKGAAADVPGVVGKAVQG